MIQDKIARKLVAGHSDLLRKVAGEWDTKLEDYIDNADEEPVPYKLTKVGFQKLHGKDYYTIISCQVADDAELQTIGLQKHAELGMYDGMLFPYDSPRRATFHMASVSFPIDIIFIGSDSRVTNIVKDVEPGTRDRWSMPNTAAVIEVNGGFSDAFNVEVGDTAVELMEKNAQVDSDISGVYESKFGTINGVDIWVVDGTKVRNTIEPDFVMGGNSGRYDFIPENEIWIDSDVDADELQYTIQHELKERSLMLGKDMNYVPAHDKATEYEHELRSKDVEDAAQHGVDEEALQSKVSMLEYIAQAEDGVFNPEIHYKYTNPTLVPGNPTENRFKGHDLLDTQVDQSSMDKTTQINNSTFKNMQQTYGYDPVQYHDDDLDPEAPAAVRSN